MNEETKKELNGEQLKDVSGGIRMVTVGNLTHEEAVQLNDMRAKQELEKYTAETNRITGILSGVGGIIGNIAGVFTGGGKASAGGADKKAAAPTTVEKK